MAKEIRTAIEEERPPESVASIEQETLEMFLSSPDVAGAVDRLLAFRLLADEYRRANPQELARLRAEEEGARGSATVPQADPEKQPEWRGIARRREEERASGEQLSYEVQEARLRRECIRLAELWLGPALRESEAREGVYELLSSAADAARSALVRQGGEFPEFHPRIRRWLNSVEPRIQLLDRLSSVQPLLEFESALRLQVAGSHSLLAAPHLGREVRVDLDAVYVPPHFRPWRSDAAEERLAAADLMMRLDRTVVLGDPGAGKSSFASSVCWRVATAYDHRLAGGRLLTPVMLSLREFADDVREHSVAEMLEKAIRINYQIEPPRDAVQYLLYQGRLLVIFDGLDELLDVGDRRRLRNSIERFCQLYPMTHVLITARNIGYEHAELSRSEFDTFELQQFNEEQVRRYSENWFGLEVEVPEAVQARRAAAFLAESAQHASDLRRNPLLLSLLCGIYAGEGSLPTSRTKIYERCVELLLGRWDALRQVEVAELPLGELHLRRTLRQIADWLYREPDLARGIPEEMLIRRCANYLAKVRTADIEEATKIARSLADFCRERTWVLVSVGHNRSGEALFRFSHRTFLEFFTAQHLEKQSRTPSDLAATLTEMVRGSASVIPHLALQLADDDRDDAGDEILTLMIGNAEEEADGTQRDLLLFVVEALRFIIPLPRTPKRLAREAALGLLKPTLVDTTSYTGAIEDSPWPSVAFRLGAIAEGNVRAAALGFTEGLERAMRVSDRLEAMKILREGVIGQPPVLVEAWRDCYPALFDDYL